MLVWHANGEAPMSIARLRAARTRRQIQAVKLMLPKIPDKASRIGGVCDKAMKAVGTREAMVACALRQFDDGS